MKKISIICLTKNSELTIEDTLVSLYDQTYNNIEVVFIDCVSSDRTISIINKYKRVCDILVSERDEGIYDGINKGLDASTGEIIGILHSDDKYTSSEVLSQIANIFLNPHIDGSYANILYLNKFNVVTRRWRTGLFRNNSLKYGWMPPHPTIFLTRRAYTHLGNYDISYKISGDYEFILRLFNNLYINLHYYDEFIIAMKIGGASTSGFKSRLRAFIEDLRALRSNCSGGMCTAIFKRVRKLSQFIPL